MKPKPFLSLLADLQTNDIVPKLVRARAITPSPGGKYRHWDVLRRLTPPTDLTHEEWWTGIKLARGSILKPLPLLDIRGAPFYYAMPDEVLALVHEIDRDASGRIEISEQVTNPATRDRYIIDSLIEEAITSSQLEGASTTRRVAEQMIRSGRKPKDRSERMILNNFEAMRFLRSFTKERLTPERVLDLHRIVTKESLDEPDAAGRLRTSKDDDIHVGDELGQVLHVPPPYSELPERLEQMCAFANAEAGSGFIHPVLRAIILHFWLAYDHPFVDGNGRTARALFYWSMLQQGYWLCEYISISSILRAAPSKYARAFLYTETDDNDVTYFVLYQLAVIRRAIARLHTYLRETIDEIRQTERLLRQSAGFNHRQLALLSHALKHPDAVYTIETHRKSHGVVYQTARTDLFGLVRRGLLNQKKLRRAYFFFVPDDLMERLKSRDAAMT